MATSLKTVEKVLDELPDDTLHRAMARAFAEIEAATKSQDNPFFKSKYADLGAIIGTVKPALVNHGLFFTQHCHPSDDGVIVETILHHRSGESLSMGQLYVPANKRDPQGFGSAQTYARRYALQTAFGVPVEDDDGNSAVRATANPTTGETPPAKRVKLDGPYTCKTQLQAAAKQFVNTLSKMGDMGELIAWENTTDYAEFVAQCQKDMPTWWFGSDDMPAEFIPLAIRVADKRRELEELESIRS
jgi:hypothetical protein